MKQETIAVSYQEDFSKRTRTSKHFYNITGNNYHYQSANHVYKSGVVSGTNWIDSSEYQVRFIIRLRDGTVNEFINRALLFDYLGTITNDSIWFLGIETFSGLLGFYLNYQDTSNGNGQYAYFPRLNNGKLTDYNKPVYSIYPNLFVRKAGRQYNDYLTDRSAFGSDPRNNLGFELNRTLALIEYNTGNITLFGNNTFQVVHGLKYNLTENQFHTITKFRCFESDFDDIGLTYDISTSPQSVNTDYELNRITVMNDTMSYSRVISEEWKASDHLDNSLSRAVLTSNNNEGFVFDFSDMESQFTDLKLQTLDEILPVMRSRTILRAGFNGSSYTAGDWFETDPSFSEKQTVDEQDFDCFFSSPPPTYDVRTARTDMDAGFSSTDDADRRAFVAFNTSISENISSISNVNLTFYIETEDSEANEYVEGHLYFNDQLVQGFWNETYGDSNAQSVFEQSSYYVDNVFIAADGLAGTNHTVTSVNSTAMLNAWKTHHNSDPVNRQFVNIILDNGSGMDFGSSDKVSFSESTTGTTSQRPTLSFDYVLAANIPPELDSPSDKNLDYGFTSENITWIPTERTNGTDKYVIYRNGTIFQNGSWTNQTPIVVDIDSINTSTGAHNFTAMINDSLGVEATDLVWVTVGAQPTTTTTTTATTVTSAGPSDQFLLESLLASFDDWFNYLPVIGIGITGIIAFWFLFNKFRK